MIIRQMVHGYAQQAFEVALTDEETRLPDHALINLADARGDPERAKTVYNFGGSVVRLPDNKARIVVYID